MRLRFPPDRRSRVALASACLLLVAAVAAVVAYLRSVDRATDLAAEDGRVVVRAETLSAPNAVGVALWLSDEAPRDVEPFRGQVYAATAAGLAVYDERGALVRRYTTLDGLPENSLLCLERYADKLYLGTESSGLVAFDGTTFTRYTFERPAAARVTALRATDGGLLVGTFDAGLFEFDGATWTRRYQVALGDACRRVTAILDDGPRLYVGTYDAGLFAWREATARRLGEAEGLPSARVTGLALRNGTVVVATDLGVAALDGDAAKPLDPTPNATGVAVRGADTWVASLSRGLSRVAAGAAPLPTRTVAEESGPASGAPVTSGLPPSALGVKLEDGVLWALTPAGLFAATEGDGPARFERFDDPDARRSGLGAGHVAALCVDARGRVWAGLFDGGVDVLDPETGALVESVDDPALREINAIVPQPGSDRLWVASSRGVAAFDGARRTKLIGEADGLVGGNAAGVALGAGPSSNGVAVATNKGLSVVDGSVARSITAFNGLPNNHTYAVAVARGKTYVGTLGGLAEVDGLRVSRTFTVADSKLPHNWVDALASVDGRLFVGTYGGGVAELLPGGEVVPETATAGLEVNPGAMTVVGRRLYVGTLRSGLYALDLDTGRWTRVGAALSSTNVTAIAADARYLYVGTEHGITRVERTALG